MKHLEFLFLVAKEDGEFSDVALTWSSWSGIPGLSDVNNVPLALHARNNIAIENSQFL